MILVLFLLSGLAVLSVELSRTILLDHVFSATTRTSLSAKPLLASGETLAALFLVRRNQQISKDTDEEIESPQITQLKLQNFLDKYNKSLKKGTIDIEIEDENSRLPMAALFPKYSADEGRAESVRKLLVRMLTLLLVRHGFEGGFNEAKVHAEDYVENLLAWSGESSISNEARTWYLEQSPTYPLGRPPVCLEELLLVYWPDMDKTIAQRTLAGGPNGDGLLQNVSLWSSGPMNVCTLKRDVAMALPEDVTLGFNFALSLEEARLAQGEALKPNWHETVFSAYAVQMPSSELLATHSRWFRVHIQAGQGASLMRMDSVGWLTNTYMEWVARIIR